MDVNPHPNPSRLDDPESGDAAPLDGDGFDLTPRTSEPPRPARGGGSRRWVAVGALAVLLVALGLVLFRGLNDAATFFLNVDEAKARSSELQGERFRMQGNVVPGSVKTTADGVTFVLRFNGAEVPVTHTGTPPELFGPDIPVVLEGTFSGDRFASDQILVKHDNQYDEDNPERIRKAEQDAKDGSAAGGG